MTIQVIRNGKEIRIPGKEDSSLLEQLRSHGIYISAACGGRGACGKCKVQMLSGAAGISEADRKCISEAELAAGWRLACMAYPGKDCRVRLDSEDESGFEAVAGHCCEVGREKAGSEGADGYDIAIDIGTTTIAIGLIDHSGGEALHTVTAVNHQRAFGADVISRIQAANEGHGEALKACIRQDLYEGIKRLLKESGTVGGSIRRIAIAGNSTLGHLLMGYSCETLGVYPFTPVNIGRIRTTASELFGAQLAAEADVLLLPGITTYVGADIAAGMLACDFDRREKPCLLIDLGTNGEMAVGNKERILVTSTAAGPAFEGGNISCGMGSIPGAICNVTIGASGIRLRTIKDQPPIGLCGTGVIETTYELVKAGLVDETGMLEEAYFEEGFPLANTPEGAPITFTQKDVREMQLAKSAVRAGMETLLKRYGITYDDIDQVFLAGGFGYKVDLEKTIGIGMLPEELKAKTTAIGNSSLAGAAKYLSTSAAEERLKKIIGSSKEVELSSDADFNELYMTHMFF